jgi:hypothetical protein
MTLTLLSPVPMPSTKRPGHTSSTAAAADAVTVACRVTGLVTLVPSTIRSVLGAAAPSVTHGSRHNNWLSGIQA